MIRQNIIINDHIYICDLYKAIDDLHKSVQKEFIMLRKYDYASDIFYDTDIYFVEKSVINEVVADLNNKDIIVWPIPGTTGTSFSNDYSEYNSNYSDYTFCKDGSDLYKLYRQSVLATDAINEKEYVEASILCDKIRIYHPQTKVNLDYIIYVDNYINDIHFHYYCQRVNQLEPQTETEFRYGKYIYSEFVEFYIPNIEDIISKEVFFKENLNILTLNDSSFIDNYKYLIDNINMTHNQIVAYDSKVDLTDTTRLNWIDENNIEHKPITTWKQLNNYCNENKITLNIFDTVKTLPSFVDNINSIDAYITPNITDNTIIYQNYFKDANGLLWHLCTDKLDESDIRYNITHNYQYYHCVIPSSDFEKYVKDNPDYKLRKYEELNEDTGKIEIKYKDFDIVSYCPSIEPNLNVIKYVESLGANVRICYETLVGNNFIKNTTIWEPLECELVLYTSIGKILDNDDTHLDLRLATYKEEDEEEVKNTVLSSMYLLTIPFMIKQDVEVENSSKLYSRKIYLPEVEKTIENNYLTYPLCITLFPYTNINETTGKYEMNENYAVNSDIFMSELRFTLSSKCGFDNEIISIVSNFNYPNKWKFKNFREAYEFYNNVNFDDYSGIIEYDENDDEENEVEQKQCGFEITIASDTLFKQVIYHTYYELNEADNFAFHLNDIFDSWANLPELLICKVNFIDKYIGVSICSNNVVITKEWFKYCVNNIAHPRIHKLVHTQPQYDEMVALSLNPIEDNNIIINNKINKDTDMDLSKINFIDKVNCIINKKGDSQTIYNASTKPRVIYKPIFYRTQDLQNIQLRSGMSQNIGINLADYMTKVETFILVINGKNISEYARNDVFTIFKIDTTVFDTSTSGTYHILNQDGEYISSGTWKINNN